MKRLVPLIVILLLISSCQKNSDSFCDCCPPIKYDKFDVKGSLTTNDSVVHFDEWTISSYQESFSLFAEIGSDKVVPDVRFELNRLKINDTTFFAVDTSYYDFLRISGPGYGSYSVFSEVPKPNGYAVVETKDFIRFKLRVSAIAYPYYRDSLQLNGVWFESLKVEADLEFTRL